jgi:hypothetical protein
MTVHVGQITSEVVATAPGGTAADDEGETVWAERCRIEAMVERVARDRMRTSTGDGRD